jgi:exonuclease VII small subunit
MKVLVPLAVVVLALAQPAAAQTLYKLIDKNGKVTYADSPPKDFDGKVEKIEVDPNRNRATILPPGTAGEVLSKDRANPADTGEALKQAQARLEAARRDLAFARENPREGEVDRVGNVGGGARPVPTEAYEKRLASLEQAVRDAEEEVRRAERAR